MMVGGNVMLQPSFAPDSIEEAPLELAYAYDGTLEGLFSAVFAAYERKEQPAQIIAEGEVQLRLGQRLCRIPTDTGHAIRVRDALIGRFGGKTYQAVRSASLADDPQAPTVVYRFIRFAMDAKGPGAYDRRSRPLDQLAHPCVAPLLRLDAYVSKEAEYARQFIRFQHCEGDIWYARHKPKAAILPLVMPWFCTRFNDQRFLIYDEAHDMAGVYDGRGWRLARACKVQAVPPSGEEELMQAAWRRFYQVLSVEDRYNPELRRAQMPVRFWGNLTEMQGVPGADRRGIRPLK